MGETLPPVCFDAVPPPQRQHEPTQAAYSAPWYPLP